jgi:hypothetical protein
MSKKTKKKKDEYFSSVHEEAVCEYINSDNREKRTELYVKYIEPAFNEMVDKIIYTYRFTNLPNINCLRDECKIWLITVIDKYNPDKGSKAFSYFSVITKNWFIHKTKSNAKRNKKEVSYEEVISDLENEDFQSNENYLTEREEQEFWQSFHSELSEWKEQFTRENERKVLNAIQVLFENIDDIPIFNKKAIYLYIREITGLNTKQIVNNLNKIKKRYSLFQKQWKNSNI